MRTVVPLLCIAMCTCSAQEITGRTEEIVPGFTLIESVEIDGKLIALGTERSVVLGALGPTAKVFKKPKQYTTAKLMGEIDFAESLAPQFPRLMRHARDMASQCGHCLIESLALMLGKKDVLRIALMGPDREQLRVYMIALDQDRALIRRWYQMRIEDGHQDGTYYITDDGTWRVRRRGTTYKIEQLR